MRSSTPARGLSPGGSPPLTARIAELEQRKGFNYRGLWSDHEQYGADDFATYNGSVWHAGRRPGSDRAMAARGRSRLSTAGMRDEPQRHCRTAPCAPGRR